MASSPPLLSTPTSSMWARRRGACGAAGMAATTGHPCSTDRRRSASASRRASRSTRTTRTRSMSAPPAAWAAPSPTPCSSPPRDCSNRSMAARAGLRSARAFRPAIPAMRRGSSIGRSTSSSSSPPTATSSTWALLAACMSRPMAGSTGLLPRGSAEAIRTRARSRSICRARRTSAFSTPACRGAAFSNRSTAGRASCPSSAPRRP